MNTLKVFLPFRVFLNVTALKNFIALYGKIGAGDFIS